MYIYIRLTPYYIFKQLCKLGITYNLTDRESTYITSEPDKGFYVSVYKLTLVNPSTLLSQIDNQLKNDYVLASHHYYNGGGTEFYSNKIIDILESILNNYIPNQYTKLSQEDIDEIQRTERIEIDKNTKWNEREYQTTIIQLGIDKLNTFNKFYLELATGAGKSYIVYNLLNKLKSENIIIFSPRKKINDQNINTDYISILDISYYIFNYSKDNNINDWLRDHLQDNKIIIACIQSQKPIYNAIQTCNIQNITIWFDEAHWSIENWIDKLDNCFQNFYMRDTDKINKRIFTSASPDRKHIEIHNDIFGELCYPITVKELIRQKWLCPIEPRILEYDNDSLNLSDWILDEFTLHNCQYGFSFHSRDNNAFILFYKHYKSYKNADTTIKPYLLIDNAGLSNENKQLMGTIDLVYNYRDDLIFKEHSNSLGYVCKQYDMGYNFPKLDCVIFADPKMSKKDIIQCTGRGTRPDGLGPNGQNLNKVLKVMLPVYIDGDDTSNYKNIIEVLRYLILDLDVDIMDTFIKNGTSNNTFNSDSTVNYMGKSNKSIILDLLYQINIIERPTTKILYIFCKKYNIINEQNYNQFRELNPSIPLKKNIYQYTGFKWKNVIDPTGKIYYNEESLLVDVEKEIIKNMGDDKVLVRKFKKDKKRNGWIILNKYDSKIPPMNIGQLEHYY